MVVVGLAVAAPANAEPAQPTISTSSTSSSSIVTANAVVVNGVPTFYYAQALSQGAKPADVAAFADGMAATGRGVVVGEPTRPARSLIAQAKVRGCGGVTRVTSNWAGHSVYLNSCDANTVAGLAGSAGGATAVAGAIFAETGFGIPVAVLGGVIAVFGGWITASNNRGQGVIIHDPYVGPLYITSQ